MAWYFYRFFFFIYYEQIDFFGFVYHLSDLQLLSGDKALISGVNFEIF